MGNCQEERLKFLKFLRKTMFLMTQVPLVPQADAWYNILSQCGISPKTGVIQQ